ncbi:MAG TPA: hypothetical protein VGA36_04215 [Nitriliruptorales bacterium]
MSRGVDRLLAHASGAPSIERGVADEEFAKQTIDRLDHDYIMYAASKDDWSTAMALSYGHARKAVSMLLLAHGWRVPDQPGKHLRIAEAVDAWLGEDGGNGPRLADSFSRSRKARNNEEYPDSQAPLPDDEALRQLTLDNMRLVQRVRSELGLPVTDSIPTETALEQWSAQDD